MSRRCECCGAIAAWDQASRAVSWDVPRWKCQSCGGHHLVCDPCVERLGLRSDENEVGRTPFVGICPDDAKLAEELMGGMDPGEAMAYQMLDRVKHESVSDVSARRIVDFLKKSGVPVASYGLGQGTLMIRLENGKVIRGGRP